MSKVAQLKEMGFSEAVAKKVLAECVWDVNQAIDKLLNAGVMPGEDSPAPEETGAGNSDGFDAFPPMSGGGPRVDDFHVEEPGEVEAPPSPQQQQQQQQVPQQQQQQQVPQSPQRAQQAEQAAVPEPEPSTPVVEEQVPPSSPGEVSSAQPAQAARTAASPSAATSAPDQTPPRKRLERAAQSWTQQDPSQLGIIEGQFVSVWLDTRTEHGWIHAEAYASGNSGPSTAGWLPVCVLQELPEGRRWMRAKQRWEPMDASQCGVEESACVIVWVGSKTKEGWAYVEAEEGASGVSRPGWLPVFCLEWTGN